VASDWAQIGLGLDRRLVEDSLHSSRGSYLDGVLIGQVHSNLAHWQNTFRLAPAAVDLYANFTGGFYDGHHLDRNWMGQIDVGAGKLFRTSEPSLRIGYGFTTFRFVHDQSFLLVDEVARRRTGGYFSPGRFVNHFAILGLNGKFAGTGQWQIEGTFGVQQVRDRITFLDSNKLSSTARAMLSVPVGERFEVGFSYDFLNVGSSFNRSYFGGHLRTHF
jgi:hypothetical protein